MDEKNSIAAKHCRFLFLTIDYNSSGGVGKEDLLYHFCLNATH